MQIPRKYKLVIVEDTVENIDILMEALDENYDITVALNGASALKKIEKERPELILLDVMMPGMDGFEVCQHLKADQRTASIPIIFLTALTETKDKTRAFEAGAVDFITKPFETIEVLARVRTHLELSQIRQDLEAQNFRMKHNLEAAARVQQTLLPKSLPQSTGVNYAWRYFPCDELAGDALNLFALDDRYVVIYLLDVSGHGVASSLLSVSASRVLSPSKTEISVVQDSEDQPKPPSFVVEQLNHQFPMDKNGGHYFTIHYGILDTLTSQYTYTSAGHPGPILVSEDGKAESLDLPDLPVGMVPGETFDQQSIQLKSGQRLYIHSDGLNEELNSQQVQFGREQLRSTLAKSYPLTLDESITDTLQAIETWSRDSFTDDISIIGLEIL